MANPEHALTWSLFFWAWREGSAGWTPGGLTPLTNRNWQRGMQFFTSSPQRIVVVNPGRIKGFDRGIRKIVDNISSGSVEEVLETIPPKSVYISCLLKNFVKKQDRVVNFRTKLKPTHLVAKHRRCELKTFLPTTSLTAYCWGIIENSFWLWIGKWSK